MIKLLLYPNPPSQSEYINNLNNVLQDICLVKNNQKKGGLNYFVCYQNLFNCNIFYFNWIENIPDKKPGLFHFVMTYLLLNLLKLFKKKIIWTYHNITSHSGESFLVRKLINWLIDNATLIIIHSKESIPFLEKRNRINGVSYFFHPINELKHTGVETDKLSKEFDILIWGAMHRYKGVLEFMKYLEASDKLTKWKIKIAGNFKDKIYEKQVLNYSSPNINIETDHVPFGILEEYHLKSRYVLFPYTGKSVLNSGSLADSLSFDTPIIGPYRGAFKDIADENVILSYNDFSEIDYFLDNNISPNINTKNAFGQQYSWAKFKIWIKSELDNLT